MKRYTRSQIAQFILRMRTVNLSSVSEDYFYDKLRTVRSMLKSLEADKQDVKRTFKLIPGGKG